MRNNGRVTERLDLPEHFPDGLRRVHPVLSSVGRITVLDYLLHHPGVTRRELNATLPISQTVIDDALARLRDAGYLPDSKGRGARNPLVIDRVALGDDLGSIVTTLLA